MTTQTARKVDFICKAVRWFDKVNGNTYHSVRIIRVSDNAEIGHELTYGYGESYRQTALEIMNKFDWIPEQYKGKDAYMFERDNNYPIYWDVKDGLKREAIANGKIN